MDRAPAGVARLCIKLRGLALRCRWPLAWSPCLKRRVTLVNDGTPPPWAKGLGRPPPGVDANVLLASPGYGVGVGCCWCGSLFTGHCGAACEPGLIGCYPAGPPEQRNRAPWSATQHQRPRGRFSPLDPANSAAAPIAGGGEALAIWAEYGRLWEWGSFP